jgi:hypothetical protein
LEALESPDSKCDVYSFGLVFWSILTGGKRPFEHHLGLSTKEQFVDAVLVQGERPELLTEEQMPGVGPVNDLITRCWAPLPAHRPTMVQVVSDIDRIILRDLEMLPDFVCDFWVRLINEFRDVDRHAISWTSFVKHITALMGVSEHNQEAYASGRAPLDEVMQVLLAMRIMLLNDNEKHITFQRFAYLFGTFASVGVKSITDILLHFFEVVKKPYFFGELTSAQQNANLSVMTTGMFMVRVASNPTTNIPLTLSIRGMTNASNKKIVHLPGGPYQIYKDAQTYIEADTLPELISRYTSTSNDKLLTPTGLQTKFAHIFVVQKTTQAYW